MWLVIAAALVVGGQSFLWGCRKNKITQDKRRALSLPVHAVCELLFKLYRFLLLNVWVFFFTLNSVRVSKKCFSRLVTILHQLLMLLKNLRKQSTSRFGNLTKFRRLIPFVKKGKLSLYFNMNWCFADMINFILTCLVFHCQANPSNCFHTI